MIHLQRSPSPIFAYLLAFFVAASIAIWPKSTSATPTYRVTPLGEPMNIPGNPDFSVSDLNNQGQVVGHFNRPTGNEYEGFVYDQDTGFQLLGPNVSFANKINDSGQILASKGFYDFFVLPDQPVVSAPGVGQATAIDMNNSGQIVGHTATVYDKDYPYYAYLYTPSTGITEMLGPLGDGMPFDGMGTNINDVGDIVGLFPWQDTFAYLRRHDGTYIPLGNRSSTLLTPVELSNRGEVILSQYGGHFKAISYLYTPSDGLVNLNDFLGGTSVAATDINGVGELVGTLDDMPFIYNIDAGPDGIMFLDDIAFLNPIDPEWVISSFSLINDRGDIVASAYNRDARGVSRYLLLSPVLVAEPETSALFFGGLIVLGFAKRRKLAANRHRITASVFADRLCFSTR